MHPALCQLSVTLAFAAALLMPMPAVGQPSAVLAGAIEGTVNAGASNAALPGLVVELVVDSTRVVAIAVTDQNGSFAFRDVPPGQYEVRALALDTRPAGSVAVEVQPGSVRRITLNLGVTEQVVVAAPDGSRTNPSTAESLPGSLLERAPVADDVRALLPLLPGVVRSADGRIQMKGAQPTQGDYQISGASVTDPSTGDFAFALPSGAIESVHVLADPFAAEYGRFTSGVAEFTTRRGGDRWQVTPNSFIPRIALRRGGRSTLHLRSFTPRLVVSGPLIADRLFLAQSAHYRFVNTPLTDLPGEPTIGVRSFDSYTRLDTASTGRQQLTMALAVYPRNLKHAGLDAFHPYEVTTTLRQRGFNVGIVHRLVPGSSTAVESMVNVKRYDVTIAGAGGAPMVLSPEGSRGNFFNDQARDTDSVQGRATLVRAATPARWGAHLFKAGADLMWSAYRGHSTSRPIEIRRADGTLARRILFGGTSSQDVSGRDVALFAQDKWSPSQALTIELGLRTDRDGVTRRLGWSPRAGLALAPGAGKTVLRGGAGVFYQRTPLNVGAFTSYEARSILRFGADGLTPLTGAETFTPEQGDLEVPRSVIWNAGVDRQLRPSLVLRVNHLRRTTSHEFITEQTIASGRPVLRLGSSGHSRYWEQEVTLRFLRGEQGDLTVSYVRSRAMADTNAFDSFFGNARQPIVLPNAFTLANVDTPHRLLTWGTIGVGANWQVLPVLEIRNGFPFSTIDENQDLVGVRNRGGRFPVLASLDVAVQRRLEVRGRRVWLGIRVFNALNRRNYRDVQANVDASTYGQFYNPAERSFGATLWIDR